MKPSQVCTLAAPFVRKHDVNFSIENSPSNLRYIKCSMTKRRATILWHYVRGKSDGEYVWYWKYYIKKQQVGPTWQIFHGMPADPGGVARFIGHSRDFAPGGWVRSCFFRSLPECRASVLCFMRGLDAIDR